MKSLPRFLFVMTLVGLGLPATKGQTLGEVLRAVQNRRQIQIDKQTVQASLQNAATPGSGGTPADPVVLIDYGIGHSFPTDATVNALSIEDQIRVLKKAWKEGYSYQGFDEVGGPISVENFPRAVALLAGITRQDKTISWPVLESGTSESSAPQNPNIVDTPDFYLSALPPSPIHFSTDQYSDTSDDSVGIGGSVSITIGGNVGSQYPPPDYNTPVTYYTYSGNIFYSSNLRASGSASFPGHLQVFESSPYSVNAVTGLTLPSGATGDGSAQSLYHPGSYLWSDVALSKGEASHSIGDLNGPFDEDETGITYSGSWWRFPPADPENPPDFPEANYYFAPTLPQQGSFIDNTPAQGNPPSLPGLWQFWDGGQDSEYGYRGTVLNFNTVFVPDYGAEFASTALPVPEAPQAPQLEQDFVRGRLKLRLASEAGNDCALIWNLYPILYPNSEGAKLSDHCNLSVMGAGAWDAVYSGDPTDREPIMQWQGGLGDANGLWSYFWDYIDYWWTPVLKQLKTATYLLNITQQGSTGYKIDFYRADQVGTKSATTGVYPFTGTAVATWTVVNPAADNTETGELRITTNRVQYDVTLVDGDDTDNAEWTLTAQDLQSQAQFLNKDVAITASSEMGYTLTQAVDTTSLDGRALPTVTTTYWNLEAPEQIDQVVESGADGTRTTTYSYDWETDPQYGNQYIDHLTGITQTGGVNPYSASYDSNELMTSYTSGPTQIQLAYNGATVNRTESFNNTTVRSLTTTYADGLATATTTINGIGDAVTSVNQLYPGNDPVYPWGPKLVRGFDGTLTTYSYALSGGNLTITQATGRESSGGSGVVAAGTRITTQINAAGKVFASETDDIESGLKLDFATATAWQNGASLFPTQFSRPLSTGESFTYDGLGQILSQTDRLGIATTYTRDALGRLTQAVRGGLTWNIAYNPSGNPSGYLGRFITLSTSGQNNRTRNEQTSPFGANQSLSISGPENITITRVETSGSTGSITTQTSNSTTQQTHTEVVQKGRLSTAITGNATEPWNVTYSFPGGGWQQTTTHGSDSALTATTIFDALGRTTEEDVPNPNGTGTAATTYAYTGGRLSAATDPTGITQYGYQPDGSIGQVSRGGHNVTVARAQADGSSIGWVWTDATGETLGQQNYYPTTGVTVDAPWGESARKVTSTPTISGSVVSLGTAGPNLSATASWQDGLPTTGSFTSRAATAGWTASGNAFNEVTSQTVKPGNVAANALTTSFDALGLSTGTTGTVTAQFANTFGTDGSFASAATRNGHTITNNLSSKGDDLGTTGYGVPDAPWTAPGYGSTITKTLSTLAGSAQFTYNLAGTLRQRQFPDHSTESFGYDGSGGLASWTTPGGTTLNFAPNASGQPMQIGNLGTLGYDNAGRVNAVADAADSYTQTYSDGQPWVQTHTVGVLKGQTVERDYDSLGRLHFLKLPGAVSITYSYGSNGALAGVTTAGGQTGTWSNFDATTGRAKNLTLGSLSTTSAWDGLGRGTSQVSTAAGTTLTYTHGYDADGHCNTANTPDGNGSYSFNSYGWLGTATVGARGFNYSFDEAGRLTGSTTDYRPTARINASGVAIFGSVTPTATVTLSSTTGTVNVPVATNGQFAVSLTGVPTGWQTYTTRGTLTGAGTNGSDAVAESINQVFVPPASESLGYDSSGNRHTDARWNYAWNALGQMTQVLEANPQSAATATQVDLLYDLQGRRVQKQISVGGSVTKRTTTLWDGWKPVLETDYGLTGGGQTAQRYYTWGPDVSGGLDGAAGVGGLLEVVEKKNGATTISLPIYDGLGNVVGLVDGSTGARVATYQYGPFGEVLGIYGVRAESCPFRYQTRLYDEEAGLCYFGKRYYDPKTQTWLSRDPTRENGGINLYAYCGNDPVGGHDPIGLATLEEIRRKAMANYIHAQDYGTPDEQAAADAAMSIQPDDPRLTPPTTAQNVAMALVSALAPGPSTRDLKESPAQPTGSGFGHQAELYSLSLFNSAASFISLADNPTRLFTGEQSISARGFDEAYRRRFTYGERSSADFNLFVGSLLAPAALSKVSDLAEGTFGALRSLNSGGEEIVGPMLLQPAFPAGYRGGPGAMYIGELFPGRAGSFRELKALRITGDELTPHHMPQAALGFTSYNDGGALMLPENIHILTRSYWTAGKVLAREEARLSFRTVLFRDLRDIRKLTGSEYNGGMRSLLNYYRENFPELMAKP